MFLQLNSFTNLLLPLITINDLGEFIERYFIAALFFLVLYGLYKASLKQIRNVHSHWHQMFDFLPFSPQDFYTTLEEAIKQKEIPEASFSSVTHSEGGVLSANRKYLRVSYKRYLMDICAAPYAKDHFFISWWLGDSGFTFRDFLISIPFVGRLFTRREKTFYEMDTEIMFKELVVRCVKDTAEEMAKTSGTRELNLENWKGTDLMIKG